MKLGIHISLATVSRYVPKTDPDPSQHQRWMTFLREYVDDQNDERVHTSISDAPVGRPVDSQP